MIPSVTLTESEHEQLRQLARFARLFPLRDEEDWVTLARTHPLELSSVTRNALDRLRTGDPSAVLLIRGLPLDDPLLSTPLSKVQARENMLALPLVKIVLASFSEALGFMVAYRQEATTGAGGLFMSVHPTPGGAYSQTANSSTEGLAFHSELAFHPHRPTHIGLLCLRPDQRRRAATCFATAVEIEEQLSTSTRQILSEPIFRTRLDESWGGGAINETIAVLKGSGADHQLIYDMGLMRASSPEGTAALSELGEAASEVQRELVLEEGDLLLLDNRRAIHGRTPFEALHDGNDRWLVRSYVTLSLERSAQDRPRGSRLIDTTFAEEQSGLHTHG